MAKTRTIDWLRPGDSMEEWDAFVGESPQGSVFCRSWWLDAVCPGDWEILVLRSGDRIEAGLPLPVQRVAGGRRVVYRPVLTQALGPLLSPAPSPKYSKRLSREMDLLGALVEALPPAFVCGTSWHFSLSNWLPFFWAGYRQTTFYTYVVPDLSDPAAVLAGFSSTKRNLVKKARKLVQPREDMGADAFHTHHEATLLKRGETATYTRAFFKRVFDAAVERGCGKTWYAEDEAGAVHAAIFVVFDADSAFYLVTSIDPDHRSGASALLTHEAMRWLSGRTREFNFEGSMVPGVEFSYRAFGARQMPYFVVDKGPRAAAALFHAQRRGLTLRDGLRRLRHGRR